MILSLSINAQFPQPVKSSEVSAKMKSLRSTRADFPVSKYEEFTKRINSSFRATPVFFFE